MSNVHGEAAVLVLAAGAGTRMRSDIPKVLHTLAGRSMLAHALHSVAKAAPSHVVVLLGHDRDRVAPAIAELADELGRPILIADQEQQLGTGHAVQCALSSLPEDYTGTVVVTYGDVPLLDADTLEGLIAAHSAVSAVATVLTTTLPDPTGYGRIVRTEDGEVIGIVEQADASPSQRAIQEINAGVYAFDVAALRSALSRLRPHNAQQELYLTDVVSIFRSDGQVVRTHGGQSVIGDGAAVGPFAYLRPGTVLGADGKLGAFVETKNATIGTGTKVPHLTYVGDADIGEHSNIGASSVFVNYDGENKSRTTIGSHVRTGSDTMFVAPVKVGDGAYTGAGTVVREDVPPGALAVSAGPQRNIEGWVERKRPGSAAAEAARKAREKPSEPPTEDD
jgi:bifunctional N-acetylglucosamine-1-phosphate-uridyltransferase/glucosamine-1-phosphate-acetyltransferase GlmU-like protein